MKPLVLEGDRVRLEPLRVSHVEDLARVGLDRALWRLQPRVIRTVDDMRAYVKLAPQGSGANVEATLLLLAHAFDVAGMQKVVFKTEVANQPSRRALLALGAIEEGILRRHVLADDGRPRDMVYLSIFAEEWPAVRARDEARLARHGKL